MEDKARGQLTERRAGSGERGRVGHELEVVHQVKVPHDQLANGVALRVPVGRVLGDVTRDAQEAVLDGLLERSIGIAPQVAPLENQLAVDWEIAHFLCVQETKK